VELAALQQCQYVHRRVSNRNAKGDLEVTNNDWQINYQLMKSLKGCFEHLNNHPVTWGKIGFSNEDSPEADLKQVGLLGLLILLDLAET
jgi:hypothetical protein